jgi:hypothetical protein
VHVVRLEKNIRQAAQSASCHAHDIRRGRIPSCSDKGGDFFFIEHTSVALRELVDDLVSRRLPQTYNLYSAREIMELAPMHKAMRSPHSPKRCCARLNRRARS